MLLHLRGSNLTKPNQKGSQNAYIPLIHRSHTAYIPHTYRSYTAHIPLTEREPNYDYHDR